MCARLPVTACYVGVASKLSTNGWQQHVADEAGSDKAYLYLCIVQEADCVVLSQMSKISRFCGSVDAA